MVVLTTRLGICRLFRYSGILRMFCVNVGCKSVIIMKYKKEAFAKNGLNTYADSSLFLIYFILD